MSKQRVAITDKNGKETHVWKNVEGDSAATKRAGGVTLVAASKPAISFHSTEELERLSEALEYPDRSDPDFRSKRDEYHKKIRDFEKGWANWLASQNLETDSPEVEEKVFNIAWGDGHAYGYNAVENEYVEVAAIANVALRDTGKVDAVDRKFSEFSSVQEVEAAWQTHNSAEYASRDDRQKAENELREKVKAFCASDLLEHRWSQEVIDAVWSKAWEDGHSSGYYEVYYHFQEQAELINLIGSLRSK